jgi:hypothetical protein
LDALIAAEMEAAEAEENAPPKTKTKKKLGGKKPKVEPPKAPPKAPPKDNTPPPKTDSPKDKTPREKAEEAAAAQRAAAKAAMDEFLKGFKNPPATAQGIDPEQVKRAVKMVREFVKQGITEFKVLVEMIREASAETLEELAPYLEAAWKYVHSKDTTGKVSAPKKVADIVAGIEAKEVLKDGPLKDQETEFQSSYESQSKNVSVGTLLPVNHVAAVRRALEAIEEEHGDIDEFVANILGYSPQAFKNAFSAEQADALAMAIHNDGRNRAFILGDQTGVGKGRVVAGMIRHAQKSDKVPIFVTADPKLYADMIRDLTAIGMNPANDEFVPLITNAMENNKRIDLNSELSDKEQEARGPRMFEQVGTVAESVFHEAMENYRKGRGMKAHVEGKLVEFGAVFTTYHQLQPLSKAKPGKAAKDPWRIQALRAIMPDAYLILDESHMAGGTQQGRKQRGQDPHAGPSVTGRAMYIREFANMAHNIFFSSATFAKRPEVMDLYARAGMVQSIKNVAELPGIVKAGGVPLQQALSEMLAEGGLMIRRERTFAGVDFQSTEVDIPTQDMEELSTIYRAISNFSNLFGGVRDHVGGDVVDGGGIMIPENSTGVSGFDSNNFNSIIHNLTDQMLMAFKADAAADAAIAAYNAKDKDGNYAREAPIIVVDNTMAAALDNWAGKQENAPKIGDVIDYSFRDMLRHYLTRSREITVIFDRADGEREKVRIYVEDDQLPPEVLEAYREAERLIDSFSPKLPASPIDWIRHRLKEANISTSEITGRSEILDYVTGDMNKPKYAKRDAQERGLTGKTRSVSGFNDGSIIAIVMNRSGATGISMHSSIEFKNQNRRHMIIAQPAKNIDEFMQMLGRAHRTGQVIPPKYSLFLTNAPAEKRPAGILMKKLKQLNANVTANAKGNVTFDVPDLFNELGDSIVATWISERPHINLILGSPAHFSDKGELTNKEDIARKVSGRIVMLPYAEQEEFWEDIEVGYEQLVTELNAFNANPLVAANLDLDAKTLEKFPISEGDVDSADPFAQPAYLEKVDVRNVSKPLSSKQVTQAVLDFYKIDKVEDLPDAMQEWIDKTHMKAMLDGVDYVAKKLAEMDARNQPKGKKSDAPPRARKGNDEEVEMARFRALAQELVNVNKGLTNAALGNFSAQQSLVNSINTQYQQITETLLEYAPGTVVYFDMNGETLGGVIVGISKKAATGSPLAPSKWQVDIAVADAVRKIRVPISRFRSDAFGVQSRPAINPAFANSNVGRAFDDAQSQSREIRYMGTNNILAAFAKLSPANGKIVFYTNEKGETSRGVLMPRTFSPDAWLAAQPVVFTTPEKLMQFLRGGGQASTADGVITLSHYGDNLVLRAPKARSKSGMYTTNAGLLEAAAPHEFVTLSARAELNVPPGRQQMAVLTKLMEMASIQTHSDKDMARRIEAQSVRASKDGSGKPRKVTGSAGRQGRSTNATSPEDEDGNEIAAQDIIKTWERIFGVPLRTGGSRLLRGGTLGLYFTKQAMIRMAERASANLGVAAHEIGHHIDKDTGIGDKKRTPLSAALQNELAGLDYEPGKARLFEGWAEFLREYICETGTRAPMFLRYFENVWMKQHPEWAKKIKEARAHARQFADQSVFKRIGSLIGTPQDLSFPARMQKRLNSIHMASIHWQIDKKHFLKVLDKHGVRQGYKGPSIYEKIAFYEGTAPAHAEKALEHGPHDLRTGKHYGAPGLWSAGQYVENRHEEQEAIRYAYARFTLFMRKMYPKYNTGMDVTDARIYVQEMQKQGKAGTKKNPERYDKFADVIGNYANGLLDMMVDANAISSELRDKLKIIYGSNYFPLLRAQEGGWGNGFNFFSGQGFVNLPPAIFRRSQKGSGRKIIDPFDALLGLTLQRYNRGIKALSMDVVIQMLDPDRGGMENMGWALSKVDPKQKVTKGRIKEILSRLVEEGVVEPDDARAMRIAMNIKAGLGITESSRKWFCKRHGLDPDLADDQDLLNAAENEPDAMATIALWRNDWSPDPKKNIVLHYDRGETPVLYQMDPLLHAIAAGANEKELHWGFKLWRMAQEPFKAGSVWLNTHFGGRNLWADYDTYQGRAKYAKGTTSLTGPWRLLAEYIKVKATGEKHALIDMFDEVGGKIFNLLGSEPSRKRVRRRRLTKSRGIHPIDGYRTLIDKMQAVVAVTDSPPRLTEMEAAILEDGYEVGTKQMQIWTWPGGGAVVHGEADDSIKNIQGAKKTFDGDARGQWVDTVGYQLVDHLPEHTRIKAGRAAATATVDFKPGGTAAGLREAFMPFSRAAVNAGVRWLALNYNMRNLLKDGTEGDQARRYAMYSAFVVGHAISHWLMRGDDDDYREEYQHIRDKYWTFDVPGFGNVYLPKARDEAVLANVTESILHNWFYPEDGHDKPLEVIKNDIRNRIPGPAGPMKGAFEIAANWNFFKQKPVVPFYLEKEPKEYQYDNSTKGLSKIIGNVTADLPIGKMGPMEFEHLMDSSTGNAYSRMLDFYEAAKHDITHGTPGDALDMKHLPFLGSFFPNRKQAASIDDFYKEQERLTTEALRDVHAGQRNSVNQQRLRAFDDAADLMAAIRLAEGKDYKGRRNYEYTKYIVGLARETMGREPLESNPSPWDEKDLPPVIAEAIRDTAEGRAKRGILGNGRLKKPHHPDWTVEQEDDKYFSDRAAAVEWLEDHLEHPMVKKEIEKAAKKLKLIKRYPPTKLDVEEYAGARLEVPKEAYRAEFNKIRLELMQREKAMTDEKNAHRKAMAQRFKGQ